MIPAVPSVDQQSSFVQRMLGPGLLPVPVAGYINTAFSAFAPVHSKILRSIPGCSRNP